MQKTQAMRMLDQRGVAYTATVYDDRGEFHAGTEAAWLLGCDAAAVYKTLVVLRDGEVSARPMLVLIPVEGEVDLKRLGKMVGARKLRMASQKDAERLTGLRVGGISALAVRPGAFDVLIDQRAMALEAIHVSAGQRGVDVALRPADLVALTSARVVTLAD